MYIVNRKDRFVEGSKTIKRKIWAAVVSGFCRVHWRNAGRPDNMAHPFLTRSNYTHSIANKHVYKDALRYLFHRSIDRRAKSISWWIRSSNDDKFIKSDKSIN